MAQCIKHQVIHRDIKPQNIFYSRSKSKLLIVLADFDHSVIATESNSNFERVGTFPYIAPEMLTACPMCDYTCDIWSAGIVFCEVVFKTN